MSDRQLAMAEGLPDQLDRALGDRERLARSLGLRDGITAEGYQRALLLIQAYRASQERLAMARATANEGRGRK
jgi:hypothetical protein